LPQKPDILTALLQFIFSPPVSLDIVICMMYLGIHNERINIRYETESELLVVGLAHAGVPAMLISYV